MMKPGEFVRRMLTVGALGFGGGSALIPVIEDQFLHDATDQEHEAYDRDIIVANLTPGALPVEIASSVGRRSLGTLGGIVGATAMALPGSLLALLLFTLLSTAQEQTLSSIKIISVGVSAFIICLLTEYVESMLKSCRKESFPRFIKAVCVMCGVCVMVWGSNVAKLIGVEKVPLFSISTLSLLLAAFFVVFFTRSRYDWKHVVPAGILCIIFFLGHGKAGILKDTLLLHAAEIIMLALSLYGAYVCIKARKKLHRVDLHGLCRDLILWLAFLLVLSLPALLIATKSTAMLIGRGAASTLMSFGGGDAYLTIADGLFVDSGLVSSDVYYGHIVTVVNVLPGSILCKTLLGIGYYMGLELTGSVLGGFFMGLSGFACSIAFSCASFSFIYYFYDSLANFKVFLVMGRWIRPIVAGLLINVMLSLCNTSKGAAAYCDASEPMVLAVVLVLALVNIILKHRFKLSAIWLLVLDVVAALVIL